MADEDTSTRAAGNPSRLSYAEFLASKHIRPEPSGFEPGEICPKLFDWQIRIVEWACRQGKAGIWAGTGLGKTGMQLAWADQVHRHTGRDVLILTPLAVARQTVREGEKFGIGPVNLCRSQASVKPGLNVTNYQMLGRFDASHFAGVVLDESDILANFTGKTKQEIIAAFRQTPYKLDCSATPAPNDHMEIGNHADFLDVMPGNEMLTRWFINDPGEAGNYRLKGHAKDDFWRWVASWAVAIDHPRDLGHDDERFDLPPLNILQHVVEVDTTEDSEGLLFRMPSMSATSMHGEMRRTAAARAKAARELAATAEGEYWVCWCNTDYEQKELEREFGDSAISIRGSHAPMVKEERHEAWLAGERKVLIVKPAMFSHGLNWQHCRNMVFVGLSYSFKQFFQAVRRAWRFGQTLPVNAHVIFAETEGGVLDTIKRKQADHETMKREMIGSIVKHGLGARDARTLAEYGASLPIQLPAFIRN